MLAFLCLTAFAQCVRGAREGFASVSHDQTLSTRESGARHPGRREERTEMVEPPPGSPPHGRPYSCLSATIGSSFAARQAGYAPEKTPTAALNRKAITTARGVT